MPAFLADYLHPGLGGDGLHAGGLRKSRRWVRDEDSDYSGYDSSNEYYSAQNEIHDVGYTGKDGPRQDRPETGGESGQGH
jgi:hypothetical protein